MQDGSFNDQTEKVQTFYRKKTNTELHVPDLDETMKRYMARRQELLDLEERMHFSYDLEATLTEDERLVNQILKKMRLQYKNDTFNIIIHDYFTNMPILKESNLYNAFQINQFAILYLYKILDHMPKGGLHHLHTTAAPSVDFYIKLTYNDAVYFNERERLFKVAPNGLDEDGFVRCTEMRRFSSSSDSYDQKLKDYIRMTPEECKSKESHEIWKFFQHKFTLINDLGKYKEFFKQILHEILKKCAAQNILIVELRHIFGMLFDDDRNPVNLEDELKIIDEQVKHIQQDVPHFKLKLIICGLKIVGKNHVRKMIQNIVEGHQFSSLIAGFDLVNEEDYTPSILEFLTDVLDGKKLDKKNRMPCFFHCKMKNIKFNLNSLNDEEKKYLKNEVFDKKWKEFIQFVLEKYPL